MYEHSHIDGDTMHAHRALSRAPAAAPRPRSTVYMLLKGSERSCSGRASARSKRGMLRACAARRWPASSSGVANAMSAPAQSASSHRWCSALPPRRRAHARTWDMLVTKHPIRYPAALRRPHAAMHQVDVHWQAGHFATEHWFHRRVSEQRERGRCTAGGR
jgi:hypothetical protein